MSAWAERARGPRPAFSIAGLLRAYRAGVLQPSEVAVEVSERIERDAEPAWITTVAPEDLLAAARALERRPDRDLPLYGIPFAIKDNIDAAGMPTTAGCPGFAYVADVTATAVRRLLDAGALLVGKTNMDQFATGLVGTRSPYGACSSVYDPDRVSGGSSSGSALAVALGQVAFGLGSDTAGSGRVPAAFNGLVGVKPTRGLVSTHGMVPACASLDCVSILATGVEDAAAVLDVIAGFDPLDPWSRRAPAPAPGRAPGRAPGIPPPPAPRARIGIPLPGQAEPDEPEATAAWATALGCAATDWTLVPLDVSPLLDAAPLHYAAWVAERTSHLAATIAAEPEGLDPTVAAIIRGGAERTAVEVFDAVHRLAELRAASAPLWEEVDAVLLPTAPLHPTHAEVVADPIGINDRLGRFTNFVNLIDLAALAVPARPRRDGLPFGVTLLAPAFQDRVLLELGGQWLAGSEAQAPSGRLESWFPLKT
ncbi:MAG TPA: allophanate hydrolase [Solirubrobacteraceae bacterium]|nr:allophanate hydrolase [Solirubrobacteraceae bacterium]